MCAFLQERNKNELIVLSCVKEYNCVFGTLARMIFIRKKEVLFTEVKKNRKVQNRDLVAQN